MATTVEGRSAAALAPGDDREPVALPGSGPAARPEAPPSQLDRLLVPMPGDRVLSWVYAGVVALLAAVLRLWGVGFPPEKVFDELYYATEGGEVLRQGYNFSPPGTTFEREEWALQGDGVTHLRLQIEPDKGGMPCRATLTTLALR